MSRPQNETWWRMPPVAAPPPARPPRATHPLRWAAPYWVAALGLAGLLQLEVIPIRGWFAAASSPEAEGPPGDPARRGDPTSPPADEAGAGSDDGDADGGDADDGDADDGDADDGDARLAQPLAFADGEDDPSVTFQSFGGSPRRTSSVHEPGARSSRRRDHRKAAVTPKTKRRRAPKEASPSRRRADGPAPQPVAKASPKPKPSEAPRAAVSRSSGTSCSAAIAAYREEVQMGKSGMPADLTAARYGAVLNRGTYFSHCGVPDAMRIHICAAVQNGVALGVTVTTEPGSARVASCIASAVRGLSFPSHPRMDVTRTTFE